MYSIRSAQAGDSTRIAALVRSARINPTGLDWHRFVVATDAQGAVIACCQIKPHRDGSRELASLVIDQDYRGQGIARSLVEHLTKLNEGPLYLMCRASLGRFYERFGFQAVTDPNDMPRYFQRISKLASVAEILRKEGETLLIMKR